MMRILADENCDSLIIAMLRSMGHDVVAVIENWPGEPDEAVYERARSLDRVLLTDDLDFGRLIEATADAGSMVILARLSPLGRTARAERLVSAIGALGGPVSGQLVVIEPSQIRLRKFARTSR